MELDFAFTPSPSAGALQPEFGSSSLSTAVREQWGLRLERAEGQLEVLRIESARLPTAN